MLDQTALDEPLLCTICGSPLGFNPDDQPFWPTGPVCGNCYQSQQLDDEILLDMYDE